MGACRQIVAIDPKDGVAKPERIDAWVEQATAGDRLIYASRPFLPARSPGAARLRELATRGLVFLTAPRSTIDDNHFDYTATRSSKQCAWAKPARPVLELRLVDTEAAVVDALLPVLERFAQAGRPCPTDHQLAERSGLAREIIADALTALRAAGLIHIQAAPAPTLRRVLILSSGAMTGLAA